MADILIVDDNANLTALLTDLLRSLGHAVCVAHDGREGLACLSERLPDLVIIDVDMPILDGPGMVYEMMLRDHGKEKLPIILTSGRPDLLSLVERVGTPYWFKKPYTPATVLDVIGRALAERSPPHPPKVEALS